MEACCNYNNCVKLTLNL